jgi:hypothetical protein
MKTPVLYPLAARPAVDLWRSRRDPSPAWLGHSAPGRKRGILPRVILSINAAAAGMIHAGNTGIISPPGPEPSPAPEASCRSRRRASRSATALHHPAAARRRLSRLTLSSLMMSAPPDRSRFAAP